MTADRLNRPVQPGANALRAGLPEASAIAPIHVVNTRLLVGTVVALAVLLPVAHFWHGFQIRRNSTALLDRAEQARKQENWPQAIDYYQRFVQLQPGDIEGRVGLAESVDQAARSVADKRYAWRCYAQALGLVPDRIDLHRRYAELSLQLGALGPARDAAHKVLKSAPADAVALRVDAFAEYEMAAGTGHRERFPSVVKKFQAALKAKPSDIPLALQLAEIFRRRISDRSPAELARVADDVVDQMVAANPNSAEALLGRYRYRRQFGLPGASEDLDQALAIGPNEVSVLLAACDRAMREARLDEAEKFCQRAEQADPENADAYLAAGKVFMVMNRRDDAIGVLERGIHNVGADHLLLNLDLTGALLMAGRFAEGEEHLARAEAASRDLSLQLADEQSRRLESLQGRICYLRAYLEAEGGSYFRAVPLLERALVLIKVPDLTSPEAYQRFQILNKLAKCYANLEQWDLAAAMYQEAASLQPDSQAPILSAAEVWQRAGRFDLASEKYQQVLATGRGSPDDWAHWAYNALRVQLSRPGGDRSLPECEQILEKAREHAGGSTRLKLLEADFRALHGQKDEAIKIAEQARNQEPQSVELWKFLTLAYQQWGHPAKALRAVEEFKKLPDVSPLDALLLEIDLLAMRREPGRAEEVLRAAIPKLGATDQPKANMRLVSILLELGRRNEALQLARQVADRDPTNIEWEQRYAELAWESDDLAELAKSESRLQKLEGGSGSWWRFYRAERLIREARSSNSRLVREASRLADEITVRRPRWARGALLKGDLARLDGRYADAYASYQQALNLHEQSMAVLERIIKLLYAENRFNEAEQFLASYGAPVLQSPELSFLTISLYMRQGRVNEAIGLARDAVKRWPESPIYNVWLGQVLSLAKQNAEAEDAFRAAIRGGPAQSDGWAGLLTFLLRTKQTEKIPDLLTEIATSSRLPASQREIILAQGYEQLGDQAKAQQYYFAAAKHGENEAGIQLQAGEYLQRRNPRQAEICFRQVLKLDPENPRARLNLAQLLCDRPGEAIWRQALALVSSQNATPEERRMRVNLLLRRPGINHHEQAIRILDELVRNGQSATLTDQLLLARLYEQEHRPEVAGQILASLAAPETADADAMAERAAFCLRQDLLDEARTNLERLGKKEPESLRWLGLQVRWLMRSKRTAELASTIQAAADHQIALLRDPKARALLLADVGEIYATAELHAEAEKAFQQAVENDNTPVPSYARWLATRGRLPDAVQLVLKSTTDDSLAGSAVLLATLLANGPAEADSADAEALLARAFRAHAKLVPLLYALANLRGSQNNNEAERLYRRVIELQPAHAPALNRLAALLAPRESSRAEAQTLAEKAIQIAGRDPELLDTLGMVQLYDGRYREAIQLLSEASRYPDANPRIHFHLALAYQRLRATREAKAALAQAEAKNLDRLPIPASEQKLLAELQRELNQ